MSVIQVIKVLEHMASKLLLLTFATVARSDVLLESFDAPTHKWQQQNDPVMGGESTGTFTQQNGLGIFDGNVVDVPSLKAPGFIKVSSQSFLGLGKFKDVSMCSSLTITAKSSSDYAGYRISFGNAHPSGGKFFAFGYKAHFSPKIGEFGTVSIPFNMFSDLWDDGTGDLIKTCAEDAQYCPTKAALENLKTVSIWAEGVAGKVHLEIKSIGATGCDNKEGASLQTQQGTNVVLEAFVAPTHTWRQQNDPVMGGKSTGTFTEQNGLGIFDGEVVDVPFLRAPGFINVASAVGSFKDVSACSALTITAKASTDYAGYRVSFGDAHASGGGRYAYGYKAHFDPSVGEFGTSSIPFNMFSDFWDGSTGNLIKTCAEDAQYCPTKAVLENLKTVQIWAEGVAGKVHLEIKSIGATGCEGRSSTTMMLVGTQQRLQLSALGMGGFKSSCSAPVQSELRYNMSHSNAVEDFAFPLLSGESLADAICCDANFLPYAEPQHTFSRPDVALFSKLDATGTTTFYDSVCGIPLFIAPRGRSFADFEADTTEHGWPSFRPAEMVAGNVLTDKSTGYVTSKCGTHLGSFLPDEKGDRWCLDLECVAGSPPSLSLRGSVQQ